MRYIKDQIDFDTLLEHKKKHQADFTIIVGYDFQSKRLIERAEKHEIVLFNIESLEQLIKWHDDVPLQFDAYKNLFSEAGKVNLSLIDNDRKRMIRNSNLFQSIVSCLSEESMDPETEGLLSPRDIYQLLKRQPAFDTPPSTNEIKEMLDFLSSPLIGCVGKNKDSYFARGSLDDAAMKFKFYLEAAKNNA
ncbi:hypothetical protein [Salicibibacter kimchii]|uniref:Uncharacterized protein n=1 Tax=Salicibibacter kimchii TaxID=2099786 RepID=A0A345BVQ1_9BACI|nr:hypothetical protein [Salicibibacter kimchii]AXF55032.1 hypothetical protein DT065_02730 [Salicibibacter kimchii]